MREGLNKVVNGDDTIVAIATPIGRSALGLVRVSGDRVDSIAACLFDRASALEHRKAVLGQWRDSTGEIVDQVLVTLFCSPNSYTGEQLIEISAHGNPFVLQRIVNSIEGQEARLAAPGEFTLRAVVHGKMDLLQAEAVKDFIDAQTESQARIALLQLDGALSMRVRPIKDRLVGTIASMEAAIDFADDEVEAPDPTAQFEDLNFLVNELEGLQATFSYGRLLRDGLQFVIIGKPNVGKSSLFNKLIGLDRAIVTDVPGTTRDVLVERSHLDGVPLRLFDTAGIRETTDYVERLGVGRSVEAIAEADIVLVVVDGSAPLDDADQDVLLKAANLRRVVVINKADLPEYPKLSLPEGTATVRLSARTGEGLNELYSVFREIISSRRSDAHSDGVLTSARQNEAVERAVDSLKKSAAAIPQGIPPEMVLLDLYGALSSLGELTGEVVADDILERIFTTFCIGK